MNITRELRVPPIQPALDEIQYELSDDELAFLKQAVSPDFEEIKRRADIITILNSTPSLVGTDVRKLVLDGYHAANVAACDLRSTFIDIGRDKERGLFRDAVQCGITFFAADILELSLSRSGPGDIQDHLKPTLHETASSIRSSGGTFGLEHLKGRMTHVYTGALFHLFDEETQYAIALRVALLLDLKQHPEEGSRAHRVVFGRHQGKEDAGVIDDDMGRVRYGHNAETWTRLWQRVFTELEGEAFVTERVSVQADFIQNHAGRPGHKWFVWSVTVA